MSGETWHPERAPACAPERSRRSAGACCSRTLCTAQRCCAPERSRRSAGACCSRTLCTAQRRCAPERSRRPAGAVLLPNPVHGTTLLCPREEPSPRWGGAPPEPCARHNVVVPPRGAVAPLGRCRSRTLCTAQRCCAPERIRTSDKWFRKPLLYPLSYGGGTGSVYDWRQFFPQRLGRSISRTDWPRVDVAWPRTCAAGAPRPRP